MTVAMAPRSETRLLVSVRNAAEARLAQASGPYLIDAKDPGRGALGALPAAEIVAIVASLGGRAVTSAVAGEPESFEDLVERVRTVAATGIDLVKVALPPGMPGVLPGTLPGALPGTLPGTLANLVVAVLFAEDGPDATWIPRIAAAGFRGAMIDTRVKDGTGLLDRMSLERLAEFVRTSRAHDLMTGLAGSLQLADIPALAALRPDYLGFRGGLCRSGQRRGELDPDRMRQAWRALGDALRVPAQA